MSSAVTATVLPDVTGLDKSFDYLIPDDLAGRVVVGSRVRVPLHGRRVGGWVTRVGPAGPDVPQSKLVPITTWSGVGPAADVIELARWAAHRWGAARLRPLLVTASAPTMVRAVPQLRRRAVADVTGASAGAGRLIADGGGVLRVPPDDDLVGIVLAAAQRGPALIVHPTIDRVRMLAAACRHAGLSVAVMPDDWAAAAGGVDVVIGARAAAWAPVPGAAVFVVLDEHDEALQEERSPTWHARDVVAERARRTGVPCVLASPAPSVTALAWTGRRWMRPTPADERAGWPIVDVIDRTDDEPWKRSLVTSPLIAALRDHDRRVVCVHNAPGRARLMACRSCRNLLACERCAASVQQRDDGALVCRRCETERPPVCQRCGSSALANVRPGVSRLREELEAAANRPVIAITGPSDAHAADGVAGNVDAAAQVFVGTEAVLHRVHDADVVVFVDFDAELLAPRYRAAEQAFALLVRAARLLGPRARGGRLLVQTFSPRHEVIEAALHADPGRLAKVEAARRRDLLLPPFGALAAVTGAGAAEFVATTGLPAAATGDGFLLRAGNWDELGDALADGERVRGARLRVEVDPPRR